MLLPSTDILVPACAAGLCDACPVAPQCDIWDDPELWRKKMSTKGTYMITIERAMQPFSFAPVYCDARHGLYEVTLYKGQSRQKRHYADDERVRALRKAVNFQTITELGEIYLLGFRRKG